MLLFETFGDFYAYCQSASKNFIDTKLNPFIVRAFIERAVWDVYDVYRPKKYIRTWTLSDPRYYKSKIEKDSGLKGGGQYYYDTNTYSISPHASIVERGHPYDYSFKYNGVPRPFMKNTQRDMMGMDGMGLFDDMYKNHLKRYRIETF